MKMIQLLGAIVMSFLVASQAQVPVGYSSSSYSVKADLNSSVPIVPLEIVTQGGRQKVVDYFLDNFESVSTTLTGDSVVGQWSSGHHWLGPEQLRNLGYVTRGSFDEFSRAMANLEFDVNVIKTAGGWYDVRVEEFLYDSKGAVCLLGSGGIYVQDFADGTSVSEVNPYVWLPNLVAVRVTGEVREARWFGSNGEMQILSVKNELSTSLVGIESKMFDAGMFVFAVNAPNTPNGVRTIGYDLVTGVQKTARDIKARMGQSMSSEVVVVRSVEELLQRMNNHRADLQYGRLFGRVPLFELVLPTEFRGTIPLALQIWGMSDKIDASVIGVKALKTLPPLMRGDIISIGTRDEVRLPAGTYRISSKFPGLLDWDLNPWGGKG